MRRLSMFIRKRPSRNTDSPNKGKLGLILFVGALVVAGLVIPSRFALTLTPSTPYRLFFIGGKQDVPRAGYVLFERDLTEIGGKPRQRIIKKVGCAEGQFLQVSGRDYFCDGTWLGRAKEVSRSGKPTTPFVYEGRVPPGRVFVAGTHNDSYDSRYFGFLDAKEVRAIVYPIF